MAESLGVYVPAMVLQKGIALGRVLLLTYLLVKAQYGLWGLGMMIFNLASPLLTLGSNQGLIRYVSFYEARGRLREFYRRTRWAILGCAVAMTLVALAGSDLIARYVIASRAAGSLVAYRTQLHICWAALANAMVGGLYHNLLGLLIGMRAYRLVSLVEVAFAVIFTAIAVVTLMVTPTGLALLLAHLVSLILTLTGGGALLHAALSRQREAMAPAAEPRRARALIVPPGAEDEEISGPVPVSSSSAGEDADGIIKSPYRRVLRYGLAALAGTVLWNAAGYLSLWLTNRRYGQAEAGVFYVFLQLGQPIVFLANAVWAVVFSHVARIWEADERPAAMLRLETAYKAVVVGMMTLTVVVYAGSPLWVRLLRADYRAGLALLGGLLMFFQVINHLALLSMIAKLHERPILIAAAVLAGAAANLGLAVWWMPLYGPVGAAWAAGVGMYAGGSVVAVAYLLTAQAKRRPPTSSRAGARDSSLRLHPSTYLVMLLPAVLLLPVGVLGIVWAVLLAAIVFTPLAFPPEQKQVLVAWLRRRRGGGGTPPENLG